MRQFSTMILTLWMLPALLKGTFEASGKSMPDMTTRNDIVGQCEPGSQIRDICERCAKSTQAELAYLLCCQDSVNVRNYCQDFLTYTLKGDTGNHLRRRRDLDTAVRKQAIVSTSSDVMRESWFTRGLKNTR